MIRFLFACVLLSGSAHAQDADIKKVVLDDISSFFKRDMNAWQSNWLHDATASRLYVSAFGCFTTLGWDSIQARAARNNIKNPAPDSVDMSTDSFMIRKEGNLAVVDFKQNTTYLGAQAPFDKSTTREHRVLVKKNGKWKIASEMTTEMTGYGEAYNELVLNAVGYKFMAQGKNDQAIEVLTLNTKLFPNSFNVFDSLGEAYDAAGQKDLAIQNYEKSLQLNPDSESGKAALKKLKP